MEVFNLIRKLKNNGIDIAVAGNDLEISFDGDALPPDIVREIRENKKEIVDFLKLASAGKEVAIPLVPFRSSYPLSSSQRRLWILSQFEEGSIAYNISKSYFLSGPLNVEALRQAFTELVKRHEILRTTFRENEQGEVSQHISPVEEISFTIDCKSLEPGETGDEVVKELLQQNLSTPFSLSAGPLLRAYLYGLEEHKWVLAFNIHHIISDGWSMGILIKELLRFYTARLGGPGSPLPPLQIQYKDYAVWQQQQISDHSLDSHRAYWLKMLEKPLPVLTIAHDKPRPLIKTYNGGTISRKINSALAARIATVCNDAGCTLYMGLLAVVNILLYRYTGQSDIIIGSPITGREHDDLDNQVGMYINTLALRTKFEGEESVEALLGNIKEVTLGAYQHQMYPFDKLVSELSLQRDMSRNALFDVMVVLQNININNISELQSLGDLRITPFEEKENPVSKFDLYFDFAEANGELLLSLEYNCDIYDKAFIEQLASHFEQLATVISEDPSVPVNKLKYLTAAEENELLRSVVASARAVQPLAGSVTGIIEDSVLKYGSNKALVCNDVTLTYAELNALANQFSNYLQSRCPISSDTIIGIKLQRTSWLLVSILGVLKAGGAYVPIDPEYPAERTEYILSDSGSRLLIDEALVDDFKAARSGYSESKPSQKTSPDDLAYVIYTSGSTGTPKGVMIAHRSLVSFFGNFSGRFYLEPGMVLGACTNYTFDISVLELLGSLAKGLTIHLLPSNDAEATLAALRSGGLDALQLTPSKLNQLLELCTGGVSELSALKVLLVGGEALSRSLYERLKDLPRPRVINVYGPTETTIWSSSLELQGSSSLSIGRPLVNESLYILDANGQLCAPGVTGEICIGGDGLARGYINNDTLTASKFVPNPYVPGGRLYKTGDLGSWQADGTIGFAGRRDTQVKVRGYRIELGEIEHALAGYPGVEAAVVLAKQNKNNEAELVGYLVSRQMPELPALRKYLGDKLPAYMLPNHYVLLDSLPLSPSGKTDRNSLPEPDGLWLLSGTDYVPAGNDTEALLVQIWQEVLGREKIGTRDNFFDLGGDSLKAMRAVALMKRKTERQISLRDLYAYPVIEQLLINSVGEPEPEKEPRIGSTVNKAGSNHFDVFEAPISGLIEEGKVPALDGVAISYLNDKYTGNLSQESIFRDVFEGKPQLLIVHETNWGRIGIVMLPVFISELYTDPKKVLEQLAESMHIARKSGAKTVTLTGLLPSATNYGEEVKKHLEGIPGLPVISTGHAATCASVILNLRKMLLLGNRSIVNETVSFIGLGSVGVNTLRMLLLALPHPAKITLCDLFSKAEVLRSIEQELRLEFKFAGEIEIIRSDVGRLPDSFYTGRLMIGAVNGPEILDIDKVLPGTLIIDDSAPHCFSKEKAIKRFELHQDILFTEGGSLKLPVPGKEAAYLPAYLKASGMNIHEIHQARNPYHMMGCVFSSVLAKHDKDIQPTIGPFQPKVSLDNYSLLLKLGMEGADLHCQDYELPGELIKRFAKHYNDAKIYGKADAAVQ